MVVVAILVVAALSVALTTFGRRMKSKQVRYETPPDLRRADDAENQPPFDLQKAREAMSSIFWRSGPR